MSKSERTARNLKIYLSRADTRLPAQIDVNVAAQEIVRRHQANGGASFSLYFGSQSGERLYAVCLYPERSFVMEGNDLSVDDLQDYLLANQGLLADPRCCIGTWYSEENGVTYLDVSIMLSQKRVVLALSKRYNQEGVFDLYRAEYLPTGGTGEPPENMPEIKQRLPALVRGRKERP